MVSREVAFRPAWLVAFVAALPLLRGGRSLRARWLALTRRHSVHCRSCAYDLTGNVSGVCPECGTAIQRAAE